ncbi:hypothetical protein D187_004283 [Cystobacter fuscus DSM 2262]|uniref:Uncharacterized protein n=1 Tax=Cystobacter fuscus (strain ATCC 25194 / DSM 2262 / NBRC 100088 / M29) TaxID=1242864 RepID=S9P4Y4_CYSF2|nr:hypothetical protein D187_004283 [Cystobacter fuscus DSM 2262]
MGRLEIGRLARTRRQAASFSVAPRAPVRRRRRLDRRP